MKILILLLFPVLVSAQKKGDNKIIVKASDTTNLFNRVVLSLYDKGYSLEQKDESLKYLATTEKKVHDFGSMKVRVLIKADSVVVTGVYMMDVQLGLGRAQERIENKGWKGTLLKKSWEELVSIAGTIPGDKIYLKD